MLGRLQEKVRGSFSNPSEITGDSTNKLPCLNAAIEEGLRIVPPILFGLQRISLGPRACLGITLAYLEARIILAKMAWCLRWELVDRGVDWNRDARLFTLWKNPNLWFRFYVHVS